VSAPNASEQAWSLRNTILTCADNLVTASEQMDRGRFKDAGETLIFSCNCLSNLLLHYRAFLNEHNK
jgi:hypothetical protein